MIYQKLGIEKWWIIRPRNSVQFPACGIFSIQHALAADQDHPEQTQLSKIRNKQLSKIMRESEKRHPVTSSKNNVLWKGTWGCR